MKIMQVADLHLDRMFEGVHDVTPELRAILVNANQKTYATIIDLAITQAVDLVLFAGDTFHQSAVTLVTQHFFLAGLNKLQAAHIKVTLSFGNHDYYQQARYWFTFPDNVTLFTSDKVEEKEISLGAEMVTIVGFSYLTPQLTTEKAREFPVKNKQWTIGMYHGALGENGALYAPFQLAQLQKLHYDYIALGHIHVPGVLQFSPPILYSGTPLGHNKKENQVKGVVIADLEAPEKFQFFPVAAVGFATATLHVEGETLTEILAEITAHLQELATATWQIVQLDLHLRQDNAELNASLEAGQLQEFLRAQAGTTLGNIFVQDINVTTGAHGKIPLPLARTVLDNYGKLYSEPDVFQETLADLYQHHDLYPLLRAQADFKDEVVRDALALLRAEFNFAEDDQ